MLLMPLKIHQTSKECKYCKYLYILNDDFLTYNSKILFLEFCVVVPFQLQVPYLN